MNTGAELAYEPPDELPLNVRAQVVGVLNHRLADAIDIDIQTNAAHWAMKEPGFIALHELLDGLHSAVERYVGLLAERVVQLGGIAAGTAQMVAHRSALIVYPRYIPNGAEHLKAVADALALFGQQMRRAIGQVAALGDLDSVVVCTGISRGVDQWLWKADAGGRPAPAVGVSTRTAAMASTTSGP